MPQTSTTFTGQKLTSRKFSYYRTIYTPRVLPYTPNTQGPIERRDRHEGARHGLVRLEASSLLQVGRDLQFIPRPRMAIGHILTSRDAPSHCMTCVHTYVIRMHAISAELYFAPRRFCSLLLHASLALPRPGARSNSSTTLPPHAYTAACTPIYRS